MTSTKGCLSTAILLNTTFSSVDRPEYLQPGL